MSFQYQINIKNLSNNAMNFYVFQKQAEFTNSGIIPEVISSSLGTGALSSYNTSGAQLHFGFDAQNYAGALSNDVSAASSAFVSLISTDSTSSATSEVSAVQPIGLTTGQDGEDVKNHTDMTLDPLGLSQPDYNSEVPTGSFGITVPTYTTSSSLHVYCGCASLNSDGTSTLSSYIAPVPNSQIYCGPAAKFFVKVGNYPVGNVINYSTENAAPCDFSTGYHSFMVEYNADGTFSTNGT